MNADDAASLDDTTPLDETLRLDETLPLPNSDPAGTPESAASAPLPRTRWAAIIWGAVFAALAWGGIWMLSSLDRRDDITDWFAGLNPGTITAYALLVIGVLALITGLVGLVRRAQRGSRPQ